MKTRTKLICQSKIDVMEMLKKEMGIDLIRIYNQVEEVYLNQLEKMGGEETIKKFKKEIEDNIVWCLGDEIGLVEFRLADIKGRVDSELDEIISK